MTVKPRKAHVKRVYRIDDEGNLDKSVWVDVLRIDELGVTARGLSSGVQGAVSRYTFKWLDDGETPGGDVQHENVNTTRKTSQLKIKNPENEDQFINLWIVDRQSVHFPDAHEGEFDDWGGIIRKRTFDNVPADGSDPGDPPHRPADRTVDKVRVVHNDLNNLNMDDPVDWETVYLPALKAGVKDETQYVDVEFIKTFKMQDRQHPDAKDNYQIGKNVLKNQKIVDVVNTGEAGKNSHGDPTTINRLDPIQMIVNVSWTPQTITGAVSLSWLISGGLSFVPCFVGTTPGGDWVTFCTTQWEIDGPTDISGLPAGAVVSGFPTFPLHYDEAPWTVVSLGGNGAVTPPVWTDIGLGVASFGDRVMTSGEGSPTCLLFSPLVAYLAIPDIGFTNFKQLTVDFSGVSLMYKGRHYVLDTVDFPDSLDWSGSLGTIHFTFKLEGT